MSEDVQAFTNPDFGEIRTVTIGSEPWFVGKDVAAALGYEKPTDAVRKHVDDEDRGISKMETPSGIQQMTVINESGLYCLILSSKLPSAKKFKRWVTSEVLPALRKTGQYNIVTTSLITEQRTLTTDDYLRAASIVASCRNERLPYVLHYLERGGFEPPHITDAVPAIGDSSRVTRIMLDAKSQYGLSNAQIGRIVGLDRMQVSRYINGQCTPSPKRAAYMIERITDALAQMQQT